MAARVPIVTSNTSALPEVAGDAALLVDPRDTTALAAALQRLAEDQELGRELAARGEVRVREFRWEDTVRRTWAVYQNVWKTA
jgi:glycosyltransferase involved in cell wall biosynthesis